MLQKIIMVLVTVFTMIASSIAPASLLGKGGEESDLLDRVAPGSAVEERFATRGYAADRDFAKLSVLRVLVDGREVLEDSWGQGTLKELTFKVGVKAAEGRALLMGDEVVDLKPLDSITVKGFRGKFRFEGLGTPDATVSLDGTVQTTLVAKGEVVKKVQTQVLEGDAPKASLNADAKVDLAYVVLETGEKVETVSWDSTAAARLYTWAPDGQDQEGDAASVLAKWVKIDGKPVSQYTWGDGEVRRIEFEPTERATLGALLNFSGEERALRAGETIVLEGFVGTYLAFQSVGGGMKLRLDGYAEKMALGRPDTTGLPGGGANEPPVAKVGYSPSAPTTEDYVQFTDLSEDPDGLVIFREWTFGDNNQSTILPNPRHKFSTPGVWIVTLKVTDNGLANDTETVTIDVSNTPPVSDWDFDPKDVYTGDSVRFTDKSWDPDNPSGPVTREWTFGDTSPPAFDEVVTHVYTRPGNYTATLTVVDANGAANALSKVIQVKNRPPLARFNFTPVTPLSLLPVQFFDQSSDPDGAITCWDWRFGDGVRSNVQNPVHTFSVPGTYGVNLTVCDDRGSQASTQSGVVVENRVPNVNFTWSPLAGITTATTVQFVDLSTDLDGTLASWRWNFGDGSPTDSRRNPSHRFLSAGTFNVCLTVKDNSNGEATRCHGVGVLNSPPLVDFVWAPNAAGAPVANQSVAFSDRSSDPDNDPLVNWTWTFGDGSLPSFERNPVHKFATRGTYLVTLVVKDDDGNMGTGSRTITVYNDRPMASFTWSPGSPMTKDNVTFTATASDSDGLVVSYEWSFGDGSLNFTSPLDVAVHKYAAPGTYAVSLKVTDNDGGTRTVTQSVRVRPTEPLVNFTWTPPIPEPNDVVQFTDTTDPHGATIASWSWDFGDQATSSEENPAHAFATARTYPVKLTITLSNGTSYSYQKNLRVNAPPRALFTPSRTTIGVGDSITFTNSSTDPDGSIVQSAWNFGDGGTATGAGNPVHAFTSPGSFTVTLTVTDNDGATAAQSRLISVANRAPRADFTFSPGSPQKNAAVQFTDASSDPDAPNDAVETWSWDFEAPSGVDTTAQNPQNVFATSGVKTVKLTVTDGQSSGEVSKRLRVANDHEFAVVGCAKAPDYTGSNPHLIDLSSPSIGIFGNLTRPAGFGAALAIPKTSPLVTFTAEGCVKVTLPGPEWAVGDTIALKSLIFGTTSSSTISYEFQPTDDDATTRTFWFDLSLPLDPGVRVENGTRDPILSDVVDLRAPGVVYKVPTYVDQTEAVRVAGRVLWRDGKAAEGAEVSIYVRYLVVQKMHDIRVADGIPVLGHCLAASLTTAADGTYAGEIEFEPHCLGLSEGGAGVYLVGWYEVYALATYEQPAGNPAATPGKSAHAFFIEDPLGATTGPLPRLGNPPIV